MESIVQDDLSLLESMDYILTNEVDCDISFKMEKSGSEVISAHKFVLANRSSVFKAMLYGPLAEKGQTVDIPDVESDIFRCFLRYVYTDKCSITPDNVTGLMYTAHKYSVRRLVKECGQFMMDNMSTVNVCTVMENAHLFSDPELHQKCLEFIEKHSKDIMHSKLLKDLGPESLGEVLRSDKLAACEEDIFAAVLSWADCRCTEKGLEANGPNRRQVLGDLLYLVRFPLMNQKAFVSISENNENVLSLEEQVDVFRGYVTGNFSKSLFSSQTRHANVCKCFRFNEKDTHSEWYSTEADVLDFSVSKPVYILGLILFGCSEGSTTYNVHIEIEQVGKMVDKSVYSSSDEKYFHVNFAEPVAVNANENYTLKVFLNNGLKTYFGESGKSKVESENVEFTFSQARGNTNGTNVSKGQIYGIIFSKLYRNTLKTLE